MKTLIRLLQDKTGATAVEYGLLAALISIGMILGLEKLSGSLLTVFQTVASAIDDAWKN